MRNGRRVLQAFSRLGKHEDYQGNGVDEAIAYSQSMYRERLLYETAGLFWLAAELAILFSVVAARAELAARLDGGPPPRKLTRRAVFWTLAFFAGAALLQYRHWVWPPVYVLLERGALDTNAAAREAYAFRVHTHLALWSAFVAGWVLLEVLIVYHGWRAYRLLRMVLARPVASVMILATCLAMGGAEGQSLAETLREVDAPDTLARNAVYLWLRLAGGIWIAVEWIAAILLWRCYRWLTTVLREKGV